MANSENQPKRFYIRPRDESLEAYKEFIMGVTLALNPGAKDEWTENQWREAWKEFWAAARGRK